MAQIIEVIKSLELEKRLLPSNNPEITWFYIFFPAIISYFALLSNYINTKPIGGTIIAYNQVKMNKIFNLASSKVELIYSNDDYSLPSHYEGPIWVENEDGQGYLLFSNSKHNKIYKWEEGKGLFSVGRTIYANNSGCYSNETHCQSFNEVGSNGLLRLPLFYLDNKTPNAIDYLVCQHGERAISLFKENGTRIAIATHYKGRRLNSPNDIIMTPEGHIYFTDPPYGLYHKETNKITNRELPFNGIYYLNSTCLLEAIRTGNPSPGVKLVHKDLVRPNGLAFSPDYRYDLYVYVCFMCYIDV